MDQNQNDLDRQDLIAENERLDDKVKELEQSVRALQTCITEQMQEISAQKHALEIDAEEQQKLHDQIQVRKDDSVRIWNQHKATVGHRQPGLLEDEEQI